MSKHSDDKAEKQKKDKETVAKNDTRPLVLIVEDNADVAEYMSMQLRKRYQLATAKDGEEGLRLATETVPDLIITDLMMPRMDGYALCQAVKQAETLNHIPVIIDSVSVSMHMTTQQLRRKLLAVLGEAPNSYIRSLQIKRAHELLGTQTDLSISQIARLCGFYDMSHFSKIFKQCTGVSPSQYRKKE